MQGSESLIEHFFKQNYMVIPVYQRNYSWKEENCQQLIDDLKMISKFTNQSRRHFFGSIIYQVDQSTEERIIIDGQQRITTIALLLAAIRDIIKENPTITTDATQINQIDRKLKNQDNNHIFLKPVKKDYDAYNAIIMSEENLEKTSIVTENYLFFKKKVGELLAEVKLEDLLKCISRLYVMIIRLNNNEDDAQMVFESINSTGLNLNEGDKIRNFLLMNHEPQEQTRFYEKYWCEIEDNVDDISTFFRYYFLAVSNEIPNRDDTYRAFKSYMIQRKDRGEEYEDLFKEITAYSRIYSHVINNDLDYISKHCSKTIHEINHQKASITYSLILRILKAYSDEELTKKDVEDVLIVLENYLVRRSVCSLPTNVFNKWFPKIYKEISKDSNSDNFVEKFKYALLRKGGKSIYPSDKDVRFALENMDLYKTQNLCPLILSIIEDNNKDSKDTLERIESKELTIEHVMPQKINSSWRSELGTNCEEIHEKWLHKLGNLTLTAYNSEMSDKSYTEKRELPIDGFLNSGLHLNQIMKIEEKWNEETIIRRNNALIDEFLELMPIIKTNYKPINTDIKYVSIDSDDDPSKTMNLIGYSFNGEDHFNKTGISVFLDFLNEIIVEDPEKIVKATKLKTGRGKLGNWITTDPGNDEVRALKYGLYLFNPSHYSQKSMIIKWILELYGYDASESYFICKLRKKYDKS